MKSTKLILALSLTLAATSAMANAKRDNADTLKAANYSSDAIAVGGDSAIATFGAKAGSYQGRAIAGSIVVNGSEGYDEVRLYNDSWGAVAVGNATSGSVVLGN